MSKRATVVFFRDAESIQKINDIRNTAEQVAERLAAFIEFMINNGKKFLSMSVIAQIQI